jgi:hypothetical protein
MTIVVDDLDCGVWDFAFETKVFNRYGTFNCINKSSEGPSYVYLHCDLLDKTTSTTITLKTKSSHLKMHEHLLQKGMYVRVVKFGIKSNPKYISS